MKIKNGKNIIIPLLIVAFFFTIIIPAQSAFAATLVWDLPGHILGDGGVGLLPVQIFYDDSGDGGSDLTDGKIDTISVHVTSTADPVGITITLSEDPTIGGGGVNTGQYTNKNLIFSSTTFSLTDTADLKITDYPANTTLGVDLLSVKATSSSDTTGITFSLTETGGNTGIFTGQLKFTSGVSSGNVLHASPGDIISLKDTRSGLTSNSIMIPNSDPTVGEIKASIGNSVVASFGALTDTTTIANDEPVPGGGGGGLVVHPGFVLDVIQALAKGGSPFIVTPPSFGGGIFHYDDGLTIIRNNIKKIFDISKFNQEIPDQVLVTNQPVAMTFKIYENYNPNAVVHSGLYLIPRGSDMITPNSIASIVYEKGRQMEVNDPNKLLADVSTTFKTDNPFEYVTFHFTPTRSYDRMSFLDRSWNDHRYSTDVRIHDEAAPMPVTHTLPHGMIKYDDYSDLITKLDNDGYQKPQILAHIHNTHDVFSSNDTNQICWLYNTTGNTITLKIIDKEKNTLYSFTEKLVQNDPPVKGDYGLMKFTVPQLNRQNVDQEKNVMKEESIKAMEQALKKYLGYPFSKW